ncbi:hypothetical protein D6089_04805 [Vibrio vulnificus]|uniref:hypothetical protein n=1 Tax=Vibrio vulnificus TaxID=672 RepID=UPI00307F46B6|nr:hypothetical protein [Vibrio vulnificus]
MINKKLSSLFLFFLAPGAWADEDQPKDMSDPLAIYTQAGIGATNKGLNIKIGQTYDTGSDATMGMNIIELKGFGGDLLGWDGSSQRNDSVDSLRFRNFSVDTTNGLGQQIDLNWDFGADAGTASYSLIQAIPALGPVQLYPLAGVGLSVTEDRYNNTGNGYIIPGTFGVIGMYSKITVNDNIWLNYNPMYISALGGHESYRGADSLNHELAASYQLNPLQNIRFFANWSNDVRFGKGDFRLEFNQQF